MTGQLSCGVLRLKYGAKLNKQAGVNSYVIKTW